MKGNSSEMHIVKISVTGLHLVQTIDLKVVMTQYIKKITGMEAILKQAMQEMIEKKAKEIKFKNNKLKALKKLGKKGADTAVGTVKKGA